MKAILPILFTLLAIAPSFAQIESLQQQNERVFREQKQRNQEDLIRRQRQQIYDLETQQRKSRNSQGQGQPQGPRGFNRDQWNSQGAQSSDTQRQISEATLAIAELDPRTDSEWLLKLEAIHAKYPASTNDRTIFMMVNRLVQIQMEIELKRAYESKDLAVIAATEKQWQQVARQMAETQARFDKK